MITFSGVTHAILQPRGRQTILRDYSGVLPKGAYVALAATDAARQELVRLCCGAAKPFRGRVAREGTVSWPIGQSNLFRSHLNGLATIRFFASMYRFDADAVLRHVADFTQISEEMHHPTLTWPSPTLLKLSLTLALLPSFDAYVVNSSVLHPDPAFQQRWVAKFEERIEDRLLIMATTQFAAVRRFCRSALVAHEGSLFMTEDVINAVRCFGLRPDSLRRVTDEDDDDTIDEPV